MKIKVHFLQWDKRESENLLVAMLRGYKDNPTMFDETAYRTREYHLEEEIALEEIYAYFNADDRPNSQEERSMCVGDVVEFEEGGLWSVEVFGFAKIAKGA